MGLKCETRWAIIGTWERFFHQIDDHGVAANVFGSINSLITTDHGPGALSSTVHIDDASVRCAGYFLRLADEKKSRDIIEWVFRAVKAVQDIYHYRLSFPPEAAIEELNALLTRSGYPYNFVCSRKLIKVPSEAIHKKVILTALEISVNPVFESGHEAYLSALEEYTAGRFSASVSHCLSAYKNISVSAALPTYQRIADNSPARSLAGLILAQGLDDFYLPVKLSELFRVLTFFPKVAISESQAAACLCLTGVSITWLIKQYYMST